jgi:hypothetical protein
MKIYFTFTNRTKEGFESKNPLYTSTIETDSVDEIAGEDVLEKVDNLIHFIEEMFRIMKKGTIANFSSPFYASSNAWLSPLTKRGLSERSLNFSNKAWREQVGYTEAEIVADFDVVTNVAIAEQCMQRSAEARTFWLEHYTNVAQCVLYTLTKR